MLISALCDYYDILYAQGKVLPEGYSEIGIDYLISLDESGKLCSVTDWHVSEIMEIKGKSREKRIQRFVFLPKGSGKSSIDANIIDFRPLYIFGLNYDSKEKTLSTEDKTDKAKKSHNAFVQKNLAFIEGINVPVVDAYRSFLQNWQPSSETQNGILLSLGKMLETGHFAFCLAGRPDILLHEVPEIRKKWETKYAQDNESEDLPITQCCITGQKEPIAKLHDKIKKFPGGSSMGNTMVSFNNDSDESYGKKQSFNSSVSRTAMRKYTEALNYLLSDRKHKIKIDETVYVYWAASADEQYNDLIGALIDDNDNDKMNAQATNVWLSSVLSGIRAGKATREIMDGLENVDSNVWFYIVGIKPNSARLAIKCIYRQNFGSVLENVIRHCQDMQIGGLDCPISLHRIGKELVSPKSKNDTVSPALMSQLTESVIMGRRYPESLLGTLIRRVKTDSDDNNNHFIQMNDLRMGLIKACINRNDRINGKEEEIKMSLDTENRSPAYLCGRLFCKLEEIQRRALGDLNRTIKDSYFASAATCPELTFPRLLRLSQHHLAKLDGKAAFWLDKDVTQIIGLLENEFPTNLSLKEQGIFMLGYYQQKNEKIIRNTFADSAEEE